MEEIRKASVEKKVGTKVGAQKVLRERGSRVERKIISMMLQFPEMIAEIERRRIMDLFSDPELAEIGHGIIDHFAHTGGDVADLVSRWEEPRKKAVVAKLSLTDEHWDKDGCVNLINQFEASIRRRDKALLKRIEDAEKSGDVALLATLLQEKQRQARPAQRRMRRQRKPPSSSSSSL